VRVKAQQKVAGMVLWSDEEAASYIPLCLMRSTLAKCAKNHSPGIAINPIALCACSMPAIWLNRFKKAYSNQLAQAFFIDHPPALTVNSDNDF
jgi:hypothetical protein